uniref:DMT family transporter n=1 Tax=Alistipes sp. TaxID=1872444 RepID=UPI0040571F4C
MNVQNVKTAHISLILCNIVWACDFPLYNLLLGKYISPLAMVSASLVVAAVWSLLPLLWERAERVEPADRAKIFGAAILIGIARKLCLMFGLAQTSPIDGSIISITTPLMVLLLSVLVGWERFTKMKVVGLLLGMAGALAIIVSSSSDTHAKSTLVGNLLVFVGACVSATYMVWFKGLVAKYRITTLLRWIYCISAIIMLPIGAHDILSTNFSSMSTGIVLAALFVLVVPTYLPNLLLNYSLRFVAPTVSSIYSYIQPVVAIALAVAMGLDKLQADTLLFAIVIFIGVGLVVHSYNIQQKKSVSKTDVGHTP